MGPHPNIQMDGIMDLPIGLLRDLYQKHYIEILHDVISRTHLKCQFTLKKVHQTVCSWDQKFPAYPIPMVYVFWSVHIDTILIRVQLKHVKTISQSVQNPRPILIPYKRLMVVCISQLIIMSYHVWSP